MVLPVGSLASLALAKKKALYDKGVEMMMEGKEVVRQAVGTIKSGQDMYMRIAQEKGFAADMLKGNQIIDDGLAKAREGRKLLEQGQQQYQTTKGKNAKKANAGPEKMIEGNGLMKDALNAVQDGVKMNNDVLRAKKLESQMEAPTRTISKGTESGLTGIKQFMQGQKLVMENK